MVEEGTIPSEEVTIANGPSCVAQNPSETIAWTARFAWPTTWMASGSFTTSRERVHPHLQVPQVPQIQPMVTPELDDDVSDEDFTAMNPSSPSAGPPLSAEQRGRSRRDQRSRSRERVPPHSSFKSRSNNLLYLLQEFSRPRQLRAQMKIQHPWTHKIA